MLFVPFIIKQRTGTPPLANITGHNPNQAKAIVQDRIYELEEENDPSEQRASYQPSTNIAEEKFTDDDLKSLFSRLIK